MAGSRISKWHMDMAYFLTEAKDELWVRKREIKMSGSDVKAVFVTFQELNSLGMTKMSALVLYQTKRSKKRFLGLKPASSVKRTIPSTNFHKSPRQRSPRNQAFLHWQRQASFMIANYMLLFLRINMMVNYYTYCFDRMHFHHMGPNEQPFLPSCMVISAYHIYLILANPCVDNCSPN